MGSRCMKPDMLSVVALAMVLLLQTLPACSQSTTESSPKPDDRFKADILLIFAHPDDETGDIAAYLARAVFDQHRRVAVVCAETGLNGGNNFGPEWGKSLGLIRPMEAQHALASLGITNVWVLNASEGGMGDTVLESLERWDHGSVLEQIVRIIRLTRPEVVITWLPMVVAGENHGEHQASSVIATEAFDLAGDPAAFAEQLYAIHTENDLTIPVEGLKPWQPKKLYFYSDCFENRSGQRARIDPNPFRKNYLLGAGPAYSSKEVSSSRHSSYARLSAEEVSFYLTQEGLDARNALASGDLRDFEEPTDFVFGKSLVPSDITSDIFEGIYNKAIPFTPVQRMQSKRSSEIVAELGGAWAFYKDFWPAHGLQHLNTLLPIPEIAVKSGTQLHVPILINNTTEASENVSVKALLPDGWKSRDQNAIYAVAAHDSYTADVVVLAPSVITTPWQELNFEVNLNGKEVGHVTLHVDLRKPHTGDGLGFQIRSRRTRHGNS
jgi:LmbE family N-acetylglucosaminyl deacetylase